MKHGISNLNHEPLVAAVREREKKRMEEENSARRRHRRELQKRIKKVAGLRAKKGNNVASWNVDECKAFLQYKKRKDERGTMPTKISVLRAKCVEYQQRTSPCVSPHASDDESEPTPPRNKPSDELTLPDVLEIDQDSSTKVSGEMGDMETI